MPIDRCPIRFLDATAQAASWYDPLSENNRSELEWLITNTAPEGQKIIDAGAYHGLYATVFAKAAGEQGEVVAIDPVPSNRAVIEVNLALNGLRGRIEDCVVSNVDGEVGFSTDSCGHIVDRGGIRCPSRPLRSLLPDATIVKLDIEGAEFDVVPAQIDELPAARVWIVEIHPAPGARSCHRARAVSDAAIRSMVGTSGDRTDRALRRQALDRADHADRDPPRLSGAFSSCRLQDR